MTTLGTEAEDMTLSPRVPPGINADASPLQRPGIPQETEPPQALASAHWLKPEQQQSEREPLVGKGLMLTPVFSTAVPTRGISGVMRRLAYRIPDYKARRWLLLMLADRVDAVEHQPARLAKSAAAVGILGLGAYWVWRRAST